MTWSFLTPLIATVDSSGLASTLLLGSATIRASFGSVSTTTLLTVAPAMLAIVNSALPQGEAGTPYTATLAATAPYGWSIVGGSLPSGLLLKGKDVFVWNRASCRRGTVSPLMANAYQVVQCCSAIGTFHMAVFAEKKQDPALPEEPACGPICRCF